jgi:inhibitor of the pro-sigma K processing machinery
MQYLVFILTVIAVIVIVKLLAWPFKKILKLLFNILIGILLIVLVNNFGAGLGLFIPFNVVTALVAGILGIPGVIFLIIINYIF